jgi:hypothetical protein
VKWCCHARVFFLYGVITISTMLLNDTDW